MDEKTVVLVDAELEMNSMIETKETLWTTLTWTIMNFTKLAHFVPYNRYESLLEYDWDMEMIKLVRSLFFKFQINHAHQFVDFAIIGKDNQILNGGLSPDVADGQFHGAFEMDVILDPKNGYLTNDSLVVQCKYVEKQISEGKIRVIPWDEHRERIDLVEFQNEWREMYLQSRFWDFKIIAQGNVFYTHKVILTARSAFFATLFARGLCRKNEIMLKVSPYILHEVLMFMYTGELVNMNVNALLNVCELTSKLAVRSLYFKCLDTLITQMDNENVVRIYLKAQDLKHVHLLEVCETFMEINCPENLELAKAL